MNLKEIEQEISKLKTEIEIDKNELENVPERFVSVIKSDLISKENRLLELELKLDDLIENGIIDRLQIPIDRLQEMINSFILEYEFQYPQDKEMFINQIVFEENDDELLIGIKPKEKSTNRLNKYNKFLLKVTIDDIIIQEPKSTDSFIKVLSYFSIEKVKALDLVFLGVPLIAEYSHGKYQQKQISNDRYVLTQIPKEKKKEIIEYLAKQFNKDVNVEFVKK